MEHRTSAGMQLDLTASSVCNFHAMQCSYTASQASVSTQLQFSTGVRGFQSIQMLQMPGRSVQPGGGVSVFDGNSWPLQTISQSKCQLCRKKKKVM